MHARTLTFLGGADTVTGSKYLLTYGDRRILVDAGMFQGEKKWREQNWAPVPVPPQLIGDILLTHAHADHCAYLPRLVAQGFRGPVWCTEGTRQLAEIVLRDSAKLQEQDAAEANERGYSRHDPALPLYTVADVEATLPLFRVVPFDTEIDLGEGLRGRWTRAGHILGSASITISHDDTSILFSGDVGRHDHPVLRSREIPPGSPYVVVESTYGDREHPEPGVNDHEVLAETVRTTLARGGSVLIPAFAIDRTEILLRTLHEMKDHGRIPDAPIYVDSPMGTRALKVYQEAFARNELRPDLKADDFAEMTNLVAITDAADSKKLTNPTVPCIIIASSGMATGGRVVHHLEAMLPNPKHTILFSGYQAYGTPGRTLLDGAKQLKMFGKYVPVRAQITQDKGFSVHADGSDILDWLRALPIKPETVFVTHGEPDSAKALAARIRRELGWVAVVPNYQEVVTLIPSGAPEPNVQPAQTPASTEPPVAAAAREAEWVPAAPRFAEPAVSAAFLAPRALEYRVITGPEDVVADNVTRALAKGWTLHGNPSVTVNNSRVIVAQAIVKLAQQAQPPAPAPALVSPSPAADEPADGFTPSGPIDATPRGIED